MSAITLTLSVNEVDETITADATALSELISRETQMEAQVVQGEAASDERGDALAIGQIALAFLTGVSAVALLDVLRPWFDRRRGGKIEIELPTMKVMIESEDLHDDRYDAVLDFLAVLA